MIKLVEKVRLQICGCAYLIYLIIFNVGEPVAIYFTRKLFPVDILGNKLNQIVHFFAQN